MFKETRDGITHSYGDACVPPHIPNSSRNMDKNETCKECQKEKCRVQRSGGNMHEVFCKDQSEYCCGSCHPPQERVCEVSTESLKCCDKAFVWSGGEGTSHMCCNVHCCIPTLGKTEGWEEKWDDVLHGTNPAVIKGTQRVEWEWILDQGVFAGKFNAIYSLIESLIEKSRQEGREAGKLEQWGRCGIAIENCLKNWRVAGGEDTIESIKHAVSNTRPALSRTNPKQ